MKNPSEFLVKKVTVIDPNSPFNKKKVDILISNGTIQEISSKIAPKKGIKIVDIDKGYVCPGLFDFSADFQEPGNEQRETISSGIEAAKNGGFTGIGLQPTLHPARDTLSEISYCKEKSNGTPMEIFPYGTISKNGDGEELSEMYDMYTGGALAFTDHLKPVQHAGLMSRALLYAKNFNGLVISNPYDKSISPTGQMNEGIISTTMGLNGIPSIAEELQVNRDLTLTKYNEGKIHFNVISCKESVLRIADSKNDKLNVSCGTSIYHLIFNDEDLQNFSADFKMLPPLRTKEDQIALIEGIKKGIIDVITSNHQPYENEIREVEFPISPMGCIGTQIAFPMALTYLLDELDLETIVKTMSINPRTILQTDVPVIKEGFMANLTLFDTHTEWEFDKSTNSSLSENTPMFDTTLKGKVHGTILGNYFHFS